MLYIQFYGYGFGFVFFLINGDCCIVEQFCLGNYFFGSVGFIYYLIVGGLDVGNVNFYFIIVFGNFGSIGNFFKNIFQVIFYGYNEVGSQRIIGYL